MDDMTAQADKIIATLHEQHYPEEKYFGAYLGDLEERNELRERLAFEETLSSLPDPEMFFSPALHGVASLKRHLYWRPIAAVPGVVILGLLTVGAFLLGIRH